MSESEKSETAEEAPRPSVRLALWAVLILLGYALVEVAVLLAYKPLTGASFTEPLPEAPAEAVGDSASDRREAREQAGLGFQDPLLSLHPFLGYVYTPRGPGDDPLPVPISPDGFLDDRPAVRERSDDRVLVGLVGGSVAGQLGTRYSEPLVEALAEVPEFAGREVELVRLGMPGYHQPQQAIQLLLLLLQGGELDVLVNIDGFNEVAVPVALNLSKGAHPLFPMNWSMVALDVPDLEVRRHVGAVAYLNGERRARAERFSASPLSWSPIAKLRWKLADRALESAAAEHAWALQQIPTDDLPFFVRGPEWSRNPPGGLFPWLVDLWRSASVQMATLCEANGIRYLHFLQPNQYVPDSKPLSAAERETAWDPESPYRDPVEQGYPLLRQAGAELRAAGIDFHDLTRLFEEVFQTLYVDSCCHYNTEGNRILAEAIARVVAGTP